jgi:hypothetical protein
MPHAPQFRPSVITSAQVDPQGTCPGTLHAAPHWPAEHTSGAAQSWLQAPQWLPSPNKSTQSVPHAVSPALHAHCPAWHELPTVQAIPQLPQLLLSWRKSTHAPLHES